MPPIWPPPPITPLPPIPTSPPPPPRPPPPQPPPPSYAADDIITAEVRNTNTHETGLYLQHDSYPHGITAIAFSLKDGDTTVFSTPFYEFTGNACAYEGGPCVVVNQTILVNGVTYTFEFQFTTAEGLVGPVFQRNWTFTGMFNTFSQLYLSMPPPSPPPSPPSPPPSIPPPAAPPPPAPLPIGPAMCSTAGCSYKVYFPNHAYLGLPAFFGYYVHIYKEDGGKQIFPFRFRFKTRYDVPFSSFYDVTTKVAVTGFDYAEAYVGTLDFEDLGGLNQADIYMLEFTQLFESPPGTFEALARYEHIINVSSVPPSPPAPPLSPSSPPPPQAPPPLYPEGPINCVNVDNCYYLLTFANSYGDITNVEGGAVLHMERRDNGVTTRPKYMFRYKTSADASHSDFTIVSTYTTVFGSVNRYVGFLNDADVQPAVAGALNVYSVDFVELDDSENPVAMRTIYSSGTINTG